MNKSASTQSAAALRRHFLDYFAAHGHTVVKSSPLVPQNDPTLMFTNAGMVQFKDVFVGAEHRDYKRAATSQKCMRVSGKHNDLEEVGRTARHHTFFEMLGNFSFGDYFKEGAIEMAWKFLVDEVKLDRSRLWVTVFGGGDGVPADTEARALWKKIGGITDARVLDKGMKDNFWAMGDTGPCGPCTEIYYDLRPDRKQDPSEADFDAGRLVEIWNNVFMQFERKPGGKLIPLPKPSVDTGMGLERLAAVVQGETSNYHSDLFRALLDDISAAAGKKYQRGDSEDDVSMRVIADHARATSFLVADGVQPSNEGRGYVMRRIMRRAIRHGSRLGFSELFFDRACRKVVDVMGEAYPELVDAKTLIEKVVQLEETGFRRTLETGLNLLEQEIDALRKRGSKQIAGDTVFKLYDTYGFPKDLTEVIAQERGLTVDTAGFDAAMEAQKDRSRGSDVGEQAVEGVYKQLKEKLGAVKFVGYTHETVPPGKGRDGTWRLHDKDGVEYLQVQSTVKAVLRDGGPVDKAGPGAVEVVLDPTPFYGESGGQAGDRGLIDADGLRLEVVDTQKPVDDLSVVRARVLSGEVKVGAQVWAGYVPKVRLLTRAHHSATHLLHGSLRKVLGDHVKQAGSLVDADHLRFDYSHFAAPTPDELRAVEDDANRRVKANHEVRTDVLPFDQAKAKGAIAMFGEKYGDVVRVLTMGESVEFCGGTHAARTGDIEMVVITREEAVAAGVRRIEAEVGEAARRRTRDTAAKLGEVTALWKGGDAEVPDADPVVRAVAKAHRRRRELSDALKASGESATTLHKSAPAAPKAGANISFDEARKVRDLWQALVKLSNARATEAAAMADSLAGGLSDAGLLLAYGELLAANREDERRIDKQKASSLGNTAGDLLATARQVGGIKLLTAALHGVDGKSLRSLADDLRGRLGSGVLALVSEHEGKAAMLVAVTPDLTGRFQAGTLVRELAPLIGGKGGGKPDLAQAGGTNFGGAEAAFARLTEVVSETVA